MTYLGYANTNVNSSLSLFKEYLKVFNESKFDGIYTFRITPLASVYHGAKNLLQQDLERTLTEYDVLIESMNRIVKLTHKSEFSVDRNITIRFNSEDVEHPESMCAPVESIKSFKVVYK
jgi:hypothetical protein